MTDMNDDDSYLLEFTRIGNQVKVTACDPESGLEVTIMGPAKASKKHLTDTAVRKLEYMLGKKSASEVGEDEP